MFYKKKWAALLSIATICALSVFASSSALSQGAAWPNKPVRIVVPFSAGGTTDVVARLLAQRLQEIWGQTVVVENRAGAGGNIGVGEVAKAANDGYTLLMASGAVTINPHLYSKMPFDTVKDFAPITNVAQGPMVIVVGPNVAARNLTELIALAKAKPGVMNFGSSGAGSQVHMAGENFLYTAGIEMNHVPYKGEAPALTDVAVGSVEMLAGNLAAMLPFIKTGKVKALGVTSAERSPAAPDIPTAGESGLPGFVNVGWFGLLAPAGTSKDIIDKVQRDSVTILATEDTKQRLLTMGMTPVANTPAQFAQAMRVESANWAKIIRERKLQTQ
jgi:tripartite-type tricarboxylate transporter receptor subunit TctC